MKTVISPADFVLAGRHEISLRISPGYHPSIAKFKFGSCSGLLGMSASTYDVVAVMNERPGNGTFAKFLAYMAALAQQHRRDLTVLEIHSPTLGPHLVARYGYTLVAGTRHAFLPVAGPGIFPEAYRVPATSGPLDKLLTLLTEAIQKP